MGKIPARPLSTSTYYLYDIQPNGTKVTLIDAWENFKLKSEEVTMVPEVTRAGVPLAILVAHIITASLIINRIGSQFNHNKNSISTIYILSLC